MAIRSGSRVRAALARFDFECLTLQNDRQAMSGPIYEHGGGTAVDVAGAILLGCSLVCVLGYWLLCTWSKRRATAATKPAISGATRLAATQGALEHLELLSKLPGFCVDAKLPSNGFSALHAAAAAGRQAGEPALRPCGTALRPVALHGAHPLLLLFPLWVGWDGRFSTPQAAPRPPRLRNRHT